MSWSHRSIPPFPPLIPPLSLAPPSLSPLSLLPLPLLPLLPPHPLLITAAITSHFRTSTGITNKRRERERGKARALKESFSNPLVSIHFPSMVRGEMRERSNGRKRDRKKTKLEEKRKEWEREKKTIGAFEIYTFPS